MTRKKKIKQANANFARRGNSNTILLFILTFPLIFSCTLSAQTISQFPFNFKGFSTTIKDGAFDEKGNHLLVGEIRATEAREDQRDPEINKIFDLKGSVGDDRMGIVIATDKNYKILKIEKSFCGKKVIYDPGKKQFTIGANFFDYLHVGDRSFSAWQPVIVQIDLAWNQTVYFVKKPYSCILNNMVLENDEILIFTRSNTDQTSEFKSSEKAEVIRTSTANCDKDSDRPWIRILDPISTIETPHNDIGRITLSDVSKVDSTYYFTTSNLNQFGLININHLYKLKNNKLTEVLYFPDYLYLHNKRSNWTNINGFIADPTGYLFLFHQGASKQEMVFSKTNFAFKHSVFKQIPLHDYADFNKILALPNGNYVILMPNNKETWSYFLYDPNMEFIQEINSAISEKYYPNGLKHMVDGRIECIFYIDNANNKDCVLQSIHLN